MDPDYQEASSDTAYHDSTKEMNFLQDCLNKGTVGENGESIKKRTKRSLKVCEDEDALQQLKKNVNSSCSFFTLMVQHKYTTSTLSAAIPKGSASETKNWGPETFLFHQTKDTEEKYHVGKPNQGREDGDDWELEE